MSTSNQYTFLPWARFGISNYLVPGTAPQTVRLHVQSDDTVLRVPKEIKVYGPGDVTGGVQAAVLRTEPRPGATDFPPNNLPFIEFFDEDFPWRYAPHPNPAATEAQQIQPWLFLLVLEKNTIAQAEDISPEAPLCRHLRQARSESLPAIQICDAQVFPAAADSWAWAHVQLNSGLENESADQFIQDSPNESLSRIIASSRLKKNTAYTALLLPAFETGRLSGLDESTEGVASGQLSWAAEGPAFPRSFPIYYEWSFRTGTFGSFEDLADRLLPGAVDGDLGGQAMDITDPGLGLKAELDAVADRPETVRIGGALKDPRQEEDLSALPEALLDVFSGRVNQAADRQEEDTSEDPIVDPPLYGGPHAMVDRIGKTTGWVDTVNRDPRLRAITGMGARVVRENQDRYMSEAWKQLGDVKEANNQLAQAQLAREANKSVHRKLAQLTATVYLQLTTRLQKRIRSFQNPKTIRYQVRESKLPNALASATWRSLTRPRGALLKRIVQHHQPEAAQREGLAREINRQTIWQAAEGGLTPAPEKKPATGVADIDSVAQRWRNNLSLVLLALLRGNWFFTLINILFGLVLALIASSWIYSLVLSRIPALVNLIEKLSSRPILSSLGILLLILAAGYAAYREVRKMKTGSSLAQCARLTLWVLLMLFLFGVINAILIMGDTKLGSWLTTASVTANLNKLFSLALLSLPLIVLWVLLLQLPQLQNNIKPRVIDGLQYLLGGVLSLIIALWVVQIAMPGWMASLGQYLVPNVWVVAGLGVALLAAGVYGLTGLFKKQRVKPSAGQSFLILSSLALLLLILSIILTVQIQAATAPGQWLSNTFTAYHDWFRNTLLGGLPIGLPITPLMIFILFYTWAHLYRLRQIVRGVERSEEAGFVRQAIAGLRPQANFVISSNLAVNTLQLASQLICPGPDNQVAGDTRKALGAVADLLQEDPAEQGQEDERPKIDPAVIKEEMQLLINPEITVTQQANAYIRVDRDHYQEKADPLSPAMAYPVFPWPMYKPLVDIAIDLFLPNYHKIPEDAILLLEPNQQFIEAYMLGLNHEMGRELLWRGFPTDRRGSYFRQFWEVRDYVPKAEEQGMSEAALAEHLWDIQALDHWAKDSALGDHNNRSFDKDNTSSVVIRGKLLKRYPRTMVYMQRAVWDAEAGKRKPDLLPPENPADPPKRHFPEFSMQIDPDLSFFSFPLSPETLVGDELPADRSDLSGLDHGWFLVFQERPGELQFGLDANRPAGGDFQSWEDMSWEELGISEDESEAANRHIQLAGKTISPIEPGAVGWNTHSADLAYILFQKPVIYAIHCSDLIPSNPL